MSQIDFIGVSMGLPFKCFIPPVHEDEEHLRQSGRSHNQAVGKYHHIKTSDHRPVVTFVELDNNFAFTGFEKMTMVKDGSHSMISTITFTEHSL